MTTALTQSLVGVICGTMSIPTSRGVSDVQHGGFISRQSLPDDPAGSTTVTFAGVNAGSEIRVYRADGVESAGIETCAANQALTWSVYAPGPNSVFRIVVVHPSYKIKEFTYTPSVGNQSLPIQQEADKWYRND